MNSLKTKITFQILTILAMSPVAFSKTQTHSAHVHGAAKLSLALEKSNKAILLLEAPGESIFGFEHEAKNPNDKKALQAALNTLEKNIGDLFNFDKASECKISKSKIEVLKEDEHETETHDKKHKHHEEEHGEHNEVEAEYSVICKKAPSTLEVTVGVKFPKIKNLQVQVLKDEGQNSLDLKDAKGTVKL